MTNPTSYAHPDDRDALSDEGIALDIAETIHAGNKGGPGAFWLPEHADALERLARWALAHGYQDASREEHERLERGEAVPASRAPESIEWRIVIDDGRHGPEVSEEPANESAARHELARYRSDYPHHTAELERREVGAWETVR